MRDEAFGEEMDRKNGELMGNGGKPRSAWFGFAALVKVMGLVRGKGTHKYMDRRLVANYSGLLFCRE